MSFRLRVGHDGMSVIGTEEDLPEHTGSINNVCSIGGVATDILIVPDAADTYRMVCT